ncbi:MAG: NMD3-related protein [Archaeoglobaceae archaeon]
MGEEDIGDRRMHPAKVQLRGFDGEEILEILKSVEKAEVVRSRDGVDLFFENVDDARIFVSKLKKRFRVASKMSTESLGFKSRARYLFVYSVRKLK